MRKELQWLQGDWETGFWPCCRSLPCTCPHLAAPPHRRAGIRSEPGGRLHPGAVSRAAGHLVYRRAWLCLVSRGSRALQLGGPVELPCWWAQLCLTRLQPAECLCLAAAGTSCRSCGTPLCWAPTRRRVRTCARRRLRLPGVALLAGAAASAVPSAALQPAEIQGACSFTPLSWQA